MFWGRKCLCGKPSWNRSHVECLGYIGLSGKLQRAFEEEKARRPKYFNVIDFLLNEGEWELAHNILHIWKEKLLTIVRYKYLYRKITNYLGLLLPINSPTLPSSNVSDWDIVSQMYISILTIINL
jgi:hypothetical protein